jgi:hypothetical protein
MKRERLEDISLGEGEDVTQTDGSTSDDSSLSDNSLLEKLDNGHPFIDKLLAIRKLLLSKFREWRRYGSNEARSAINTAPNNNHARCGTSRSVKKARKARGDRNTPGGRNVDLSHSMG